MEEANINTKKSSFPPFALYLQYDIRGKEEGAKNSSHRVRPSKTWKIMEENGMGEESERKSG